MGGLRSLRRAMCRRAGVEWIGRSLKRRAEDEGRAAKAAAQRERMRHALGRAAAPAAPAAVGVLKRALTGLQNLFDRGKS